MNTESINIRRAIVRECLGGQKAPVVGDMLEEVNGRLQSRGLKPVSRRTLEGDLKWVRRHGVEAEEGESVAADSVATHDTERRLRRQTERILYEENERNQDKLLRVIRECFAEEVACQVAYRPYTYGEGSESQRFVMSPHVLKQYNLRWYLVGKRHDRPEVEPYIIELDRILSVSKSRREAYEKPRRGFNPREYFGARVGLSRGEQGDRAQRVVLWVGESRWPYLKSRPLLQSQALCASQEHPLAPVGEEGRIVELRAVLNHELKNNLLFYGPDLIVLEPAELREEMRRRASEMAGRYEPTKM